MKKLLVFISLGLAFGAPGEVHNQILARQNVRAFGGTMISHAVLLLIGFFVGKGISAVFKRSTARLIYHLLFGCLGLMVEGFLLGNAPVLEPFQIITQPGMFTYWGTMLLAPWLMMEPEFRGMRWSFASYSVLFSIFYLLVALLVPRDKGGIYFGFILQWPQDRFECPDHQIAPECGCDRSERLLGAFTGQVPLIVRIRPSNYKNVCPPGQTSVSLTISTQSSTLS